MSNKDHVENQKTIWNETAKDEKSTHPDKLQADLELNFMLRNVHGRVLNAGCGAGYETLCCANKTGFAVGVDFSEKMIEIAKKRERENIVFRIGDVLDLKNVVDEFGTFDTVTTRRLLINQYSWNYQKKVIEEFRKCLNSNGNLIIIEAMDKGYYEMNALRSRLGISEIKVVNYNHPIPLYKFNSFMRKNWILMNEDSMSTYYFLTRIFYPLIEEPKYGSHFANQAVILQNAIGSIKFPSPILMRHYCLRSSKDVKK